MPLYRYEHTEAACPIGAVFEVSQSMREEALATCPECGGPVERIIGPTYVNVPTSDTDLRDKGFAKLVRRDNGVYENVTALDGESKVWEKDKPETMPDVKRRISD
jgi:putative FmdB family regulatory protein